MSQDPSIDKSEMAAGESVRRRDFINIAALSFAGVGGLATVVPLIRQMSPSADVLALGAPSTVDISTMSPGQQIIVTWRSMPIFIVKRTPAELGTLRQPAHLSHLRDPDSQVTQQPEYAANWSRSIKPEYLVLVGICTHLGCIPSFKPQTGYFCPCHGSRYDLAGRVFQDVPAPYNLPVPPYHFVNDTTLEIGANPVGGSFSVNSIVQM